MQVQIDVLQEDIDKNGKFCTNCPIALALKRKFINKTPTVMFSQFWFQDDGIKQYKLPDIAYQFRDTYDVSGPKAVKPISFSFDYEE